MAVISGRGTEGPANGRTGGPAGGSGANGSQVSQREDLANFISMITRDETPFMSSIGKTKATAIFHEWQTDSLEAPGDSTISEGTDYIVPGGVNPTTGADAAVGIGTTNGQTVGDQFAIVGPNRSRLGNYAQINGKTIAVSGTRRAIDQAGVADEYAYQLKKRGTELRRDVERDLVHTYQVATGSGNRKFGGYQSFINVDDNSFAGGQFGTVELNGAGAASAKGVGSAAPALTAVANRAALSLSDIDSVMQRIYQEGGKATKVMLSPKLRRDFSDLMVTDTGVRRNIDTDGKLRQSVDVYMSDFGDLMVVPNYVMGLATRGLSGTGGGATNIDGINQRQDSCALIYDPMWFAIATLRPLAEVDVGQRGDSTVGMLVEECSLEVKNPVGCGAIYNLR